MPALSVLLPVRNGAPTIAETVHSVLNQSFGDFELLVIDDASSDDTREVLDGFSDPRIRVIDNPGSGLVEGLNAGIASAAAPIISRIDADDLMLPGRLSTEVRAFDLQPGLGLFASGALSFRDQGRIVDRRHCFATDRAMKLMLLRETGFSHSAVAYRAKAVLTVGGYRREAFPAEDYDLWLRMAIAGAEFSGADTPLTSIRLSAGSVSDRYRREQRSASLDLRREAAGSPLADLAAKETFERELRANPSLNGTAHLARLQMAAVLASGHHLRRWRVRSAARALNAAGFSLRSLVNALYQRRRASRHRAPDVGL